MRRVHRAHVIRMTKDWEQQVIWWGALFLACLYLMGCAPSTTDSPNPTSLGKSKQALSAADDYGLPISAQGLEAYWTLDQTWDDATGQHTMVPQRAGGFQADLFTRAGENYAYGPTGEGSQNGAQAASFTTIQNHTGITLEGWVWMPDNSTGGNLFSFGESRWGVPHMGVFASWGYLMFSIGNQQTALLYKRVGDKCWHHVAVVLPANFQSGGEWKFYVDGEEIAYERILRSATGGPSIVNQTVFGQPFRIGEFSYSSASKMRVDEVRVWSRALSAQEVGSLHQHQGSGQRCNLEVVPSWAPGQRCQFVGGLPSPQLQLGVRVLTQDTLAVVTDANDWLKSRVLGPDCGAFLQALEQNRASVQDWLYERYYKYSAKEGTFHYRPQLLQALSESTHLTLVAPDQSTSTTALLGVWPQATREMKWKTLTAVNPPTLRMEAANLVYFSYIKLSSPLVPGATYTLRDRWGNQQSFVYDENNTISWAIKTNQEGYLDDAGKKYAYLGSWLGSGATLDLASFSGQSFQVVKESDQSVAFQGQITFRSNDRLTTSQQPVYGESIYQLDFSAVTEPGRYYLRIPGMGRSWSFEVGKDWLGKSFYTYMRGLFHQRAGMAMTSTYTPWERPAGHTQVYVAAFPPDEDDYADHASAGWGIRDSQGQYVSFSRFQMVEITKTNQIANNVSGGWFDAADFDQRPFHLGIVKDLSHLFLQFSGNFSDSQLKLPESGNSVPDMLDEAVWGLDVLRRAQGVDGRVPTAIESTSHHSVQDYQPYYLALATRNSSLHYAAAAALLSRALSQAGDTTRASLFLQSAQQAYNFATNGGTPISISFSYEGQNYTWTEAAQPSASRRFDALVQLWLATGQQSYRDALDDAEMASVFQDQLNRLHYQGTPFDYLEIAQQPSSFPAGWASSAQTRILALADERLVWQEQNPYRHVWYPETHGYFLLSGYGNSQYRPIKFLITAWRLTQNSSYRTGALLGVDWLMGTNPQGRLHSSGLGQNTVSAILHLWSSADNIQEAVPGLVMPGWSSLIPWQAANWVYGQFENADPSYGYPGAQTPQLPPAWIQPGMTEQQVRDKLYEKVPVWRRLVLLEDASPAVMEPVVWETMSDAAIVTGALMGTGWSPSNDLLQRQPRSATAMLTSEWCQP
ncbi:MAG: glycoside hydrolase family 9 protein [Myxococcales bacterium]|nr:glycoside hydrolase family 9 protein [Myxococcales bacterium]